MAQQTTLPFFRQKRAAPNLNVPRRYEIPVKILRASSFLPAIFSLIQNFKASRHVLLRDAGGPLSIQTTQSEYYIAIFWCILSGYWNWVLSSSLLKRWLYQFEIKNAAIRLVAFILVSWVVSLLIESWMDKSDPVIVQMTICFILMVLNLAKITWKSGSKYDQKLKNSEEMTTPELDLRQTAIRILLLPLLVVMTVSVLILTNQVDYFQYRSILMMNENQFGLDDTVSPGMTGMTVLVLILSSWTASEKRQLLRETTLNWMDERSDVTFVYRFVVGQAPSGGVQSWFGPRLVAESETYGDLLLVPAPDLESDKGKKLYEALRWASSSVQHDYIIKTDDDVFVRYDVLRNELSLLGQKDNYWRGLVYRNMPINHFNPTNNMELDYAIPVLPTFTSGTLTILSRNLVDLIAQINYPQRFVDADDVNLSMWLFGFELEPIHDKRILNDPEVCEDTAIAKRFNSLKTFKKEIGLLYNNLKNKQTQCRGLNKQKKCAICYPCYNRSDDWRSQNLHCDSARGISLQKQPEFKKVTSLSVKDQLEPSVIGQNDVWIIPDVISARTSIYTEDEANWHLLYWVCWTSDPSTFTDRHWRALEMVWIHEPNAAIFMISNSLPTHFFDEYTRRGYNIQVVSFNKENLLRWKWYFGPGTQDWLEGWDKWEKGKFFYWHLTDYIRCLLLYNYGGTYMDMDALWIRVPPDSNAEFIGSDYSSVQSDLEWTLDDKGLYLPQGLMRFKRGWKLFREMAEGAFSAYTYDPECFNCGGPKAITTYVRERRAVLEAGGLTILPRQVLYPYSYLEIHHLLQPNPLAEQDMRYKIEPISWNIHLFGKMTNHLPVQPNSVIDYVFKKFDLDIPHRDTKTHKIISSTQTTEVPLKLVGPRDYLYQAVSERMLQDDQKKQNLLRLQPKPGRFQGINVLYVRGGPDQLSKVTVEVESALGKVLMMNGTFEKQANYSMENPSMREVNAVLNSIEFLPAVLMLANGGRDRLKVKLSYEYGKVQETQLLQIPLVIVEPREEDEVFSEELDEAEKKLIFEQNPNIQ